MVKKKYDNLIKDMDYTILEKEYIKILDELRSAGAKHLDRCIYYPSGVTDKRDKIAVQKVGKDRVIWAKYFFSEKYRLY